VYLDYNAEFAAINSLVKDLKEKYVSDLKLLNLEGFLTHLEEINVNF
jgi:hypothetical protein